MFCLFYDISVKCYPFHILFIGKISNCYEPSEQKQLQGSIFRYFVVHLGGEYC